MVKLGVMKMLLLSSFDLDDQDQSLLKTIGVLGKESSTSGPNMMILAWTGDELSSRKCVNGTQADRQADTHRYPKAKTDLG